MDSSPEIFSDNIVSKSKSTKSLSKMKKPELYELCKQLVDDNKRLQLFSNSSDELLQTYMKHEKELQIKINKLQYDYQTTCLDYDKLAEDKNELEDTLKLKEDEVSELIYENSDLKQENNKLKSFLCKIRKTFTE